MYTMVFFPSDTSVREEGPMHKTYREPSDPELQVYDPWGRSGAGAPIRDAYGQPVAQFTGQVHTIRGVSQGDHFNCVNLIRSFN